MVILEIPFFSAGPTAKLSILKLRLANNPAILVSTPDSSSTSLYRTSLSSAMRVQARTEGPRRSFNSGRGMWYTFFAAPLPGIWLLGPACAVRVCRPNSSFVGHMLPFLQMRRFFTGALVQMCVSFLTGSLYWQYDTFWR